MKKVGILYHPFKEGAHILTKKLEDFMVSQGVSVWLCPAADDEKTKMEVDGTDLVLTIGGDGTILRAVQSIFPSLIPITGINLGKLGFMTELTVDETFKKLPELLAGKGWIDERCLIEAELAATSENEAVCKFYALNDVVVARGAVARLVDIETRINDELLTTYKADGVIVATATGSTGYSLAAGGPILHPQAKEFLLLPILPHLGSSYALVLPATAAVRLHLTTINPATLSIDGHINLTLSNGATITVRRSINAVRFLRIHSQNSFYSSLEQKLKGK